MDDQRKFAPGRYFRRGNLFLDFDDGGYLNSYSVLDADAANFDTGITINVTGHSREGGSRKQTFEFRGVAYPSLREAIFAYEDAKAVQPSSSGGET